MQTTFKTTNEDILEQVRALVDKRFGSLERVLAKESEHALLSLEVARETKQQSGRVFHATGNLTVNGKKYHADAWGDTVESVTDSVRDDLVREVRTKRGRAMRILRKGGGTLKTLLRFGKR